jgi:dipeptidase D
MTAGTDAARTPPPQNDTAYILKVFAALAAIPRPSKQEKAVSDYLKNWAVTHGMPVIQDASNNIVMEKDASPGCENAPRTILQAHMDMVCVSDEHSAGKDYDPATHPIRIRKNPQDNTISAAGSSLGADDGIGVAIIQCLFQAKALRHGPLRAVITTDEEAGMSGARNLDAAHLNAAYLINIDWERYGSLCNGSADINVYRFRRPLTLRKPRLNSAGKLVVSGLAGGHSGIDIHTGRANALCTAAHILADMKRAGVALELADFGGGTANNAIPTRAEALVCLDAAQAECAARIAGDAAKMFKAAYGEREKHALITFSACSAPQCVLSDADADALLALITATRNGAYARNQAILGFVESSSNLGWVRIQDGRGVTAEIAARSCLPWHAEDMRHGFATLAALTGFAFDIPSACPAWPVKPDSRLAAYACAAFRELTGRAMAVEPAHVGLECGIFAVKNPDLEMIAIGPRIDNAHSIAETLHLDGVSGTLRCIVKILEKIALCSPV